jgi:5-methylcytosine-specific restriction endonuclease McrA
VSSHSPAVKFVVWQRDGGRCVECGTRELLEYDHIITFSKGGSNTERNIQLLCEKCNRKKSATIQLYYVILESKWMGFKYFYDKVLGRFMCLNEE